MQTVILVIHLMVIVALVGVVLIQRSEGGALGIGGGGGFMTSRGSANVLTRATAILAAIFFVTSIALTVLPRLTGSSGSILDNVAPSSSTTLPDISGSGNGVLDQLNKMKAPAPAGAPQPAAPQPGAQVPGAQVPASETPAAPATEAPSGAAAPAEGSTTGDVPSLSDAPVTEPPATADTPAGQ